MKKLIVGALKMTTPLRIIFAGTPDFAATHLAALLESDHEIVAVLSQPDRPAGRGKKLKLSPVKQLAAAHEVPVLQPLTLKSQETQQQLRELDADIMVVVAYGLILPQTVLDIPRFGCLNVHASLLPRWRGAAPIQRAVQAGDEVSGVTIMQMEAGLDTGPMLNVKQIPLLPDETGGSLHDRLAEIGPEALLFTLDNIDASLAAAQPQDHHKANYAHKIGKEECAIEWQDNAGAIARRIRAFNPTPNCFSFLGSERVKFWMAHTRKDSSDAPPGTVIEANKHNLVIQCGEGQLVVTEAQFSGSRPMNIAALLNGKATQLTPGAIFTHSIPENS